MKKIEEYANSVAKQVLGKEDLSGIDPVTVVAIVTAVMDIVMEVIEKCKENKADKVASTIKNPGLFNRVRFNRLVRQRLGDNSDVVTPEILADACAKVADKTDAVVVEEVVKEVKKVDYWLI